MFSRSKQIIVAATIALLAVGSTASAQHMVTRQVDGDAFMLHEIGALVTEKDGKILLDVFMPKDGRKTEYREVDLESKDELVMINGKRIKDVALLQEIYDALDTGAEVKFGIKRDGSLRIVSFKKADPKEFEGMVMKTVTMDGGGGSGTWSGTEGGAMEAIMELALLIGDTDNGVEVADVIEGLPSASKEYSFAAGDVILSIGGKKIKKTSEFTELFGAIPTGDTVELLVLHKGAEIKVTFTKPKKAAGKMMMRSSGN